ncbi:alginate O-acetyltransferase [Spirochaetia bacterium]|nr:alginate O-acetyltransferase [Spirochaetia bacterium]
MNFNSWQFLVFFPVIAVLYFAVTAWVRKNADRTLVRSQLLLLAASLFFYMCWNPVYLCLILFSVAITWTSGILMSDHGSVSRSTGQKKLILASSLALNLAVLFFFKYYNFFAGTMNSLFGQFGAGAAAIPTLNVLLPVGISFYTFQALGYSIDVYRGAVKAEQNFLTYALFVTFFPQLVAGPIERTGNLLPQFKIDHHFDYDRVTEGLKLAAWGMFKKVVIADQLAVYVNAVYGNPGVYPASALLLATFFFTFQIYCDFSGYSDIAIGTARVLGFNLMTNFRKPYFSQSITEFWRRWHISLSTWLKDYLYIPLGGNRKGAARQKLNLLITFLISGLWHGAAWHFVFWGLLHGLFQIIERSIPERINAALNKVPALRVCITFLLVCFAWIFFRAGSLPDAFLIVRKLASLPGEWAGYLAELPKRGIVNTVRAAFQLGAGNQGITHPITGFGMVALAFSVLSIVILIVADAWSRNTTGTSRIMRLPPVMRWAGYYALILIIIFNWAVDSSQFIYFTF